MVTLSVLLSYLYPNADPLRDYAVADAGSGPFIEHWNLALGPQPTQAELDAVAVPAARTVRLAAVRAEAASCITAKWPLWAQNNCALGIYPDATVAQCAADIAAVIAASNAAEDAIEAATTVAEVEAVTATWPTL